VKSRFGGKKSLIEEQITAQMRARYQLPARPTNDRRNADNGSDDDRR